MIETKDCVESRYVQTAGALLGQIKQRSYALMQIGPGQLVLDIGCGSGIDTVALAHLVGPSGQRSRRTITAPFRTLEIASPPAARF